MKNLKFNKDITLKNYDDETKELITTLKSNNILLACFKANKLDISEVDDYAWFLKGWLEEVKACEGCKGLKACTQKNKGFYPNLKKNAFLEIQYEACKYKRDDSSKKAHLSNYLINHLSKKMETITLEDIELYGEDAEYGKVYDAVVDKYNNDEGLYLYGTMGSGKTHLAASVANEYAKDKKKVCFIHYPTFTLEMANKAFSDAAGLLLERAMRCDFLVLDDIGAESVTEYNRDQVLLPILNYRYENDKTTWFTSNMDINKLTEHFTTSSRGTEDELKALRIIERIKHMATSVLLNTRDRRD